MWYTRARRTRAGFRLVRRIPGSLGRPLDGSAQPVIGWFQRERTGGRRAPGILSRQTLALVVKSLRQTA